MTNTNYYHQLKRYNQKQDGFAAFTVTLILMVVLALIVLGFAANSRNEQNRALNSQLNTTAYYAAESGINDAYTIIKNDLLTSPNTPLPSQTTQSTGCNNGPYEGSASSGTLTPATAGVGTVAYTCLLVNPVPPSLEYSPIDAGHGQVVPLFGVNSGNPADINTISVSWQEHGANSLNFVGCPTSTTTSFNSETTWNANCTAPVLQIDIVPATGWNSVQGLQIDTDTVFLEPLSSGGSAGPNAVSNGKIIGTTCQAGSGGEYECTTTLTAPEQLQTGYYLRVVPIYQNADVSIKAVGGGNGTPLSLANAQALIDSTGKAGNQLKRIQEYVSINPVGDNTNDVPINALQGENGVCKQLTTRPGVTSGSTSTCN